MTLVLRMIRTLRRLSLEDVAEECGIHRVMLQQIETNRVEPSKEVRDALASHFGLDYKILKQPVTDDLVRDTEQFIAGRAS